MENDTTSLFATIGQLTVDNNALRQILNQATEKIEVQRAYIQKLEGKLGVNAEAPTPAPSSAPVAPTSPVPVPTVVNDGTTA